MSSDPIEVLREVYWAGWLNASTWANRDDQLDDRGSEAYKKLEGEAVQPALASLSAPKPSSVNDNAVAVNESAPVNDKPESAEAVGEVLRSGDGVARVAMFNDSLRPGTKVYTAPPRPEASAPVGVVLSAKEREWLEYAVDQMAAASGPEDAICYEVLHGLMTRVDALAQQPAACDMGALCIGCEPRNADGSCPGQQSAADTYNRRLKAQLEQEWVILQDLKRTYQTRQPATPPRCGDERYELDAYLWRRESTQEWVLELSGAINDTSFTNRFPVPLSYAPEDAASLPNYAQQPAACHKCGGTGEADSGGIMPWGAPATIPCECQQPAAVDEAMVERALRGVEKVRGYRDHTLTHSDMRAALTAALAGQSLKNESDQEQHGGTPE